MQKGAIDWSKSFNTKNTLSTWSLKYILSRTRPFCRIMHSNIFYIQLGPAVALVTLVPAVTEVPGPRSRLQV